MSDKKTLSEASNKEKRSWFKSTNYNKLVIIQHRSIADASVANQIVISDLDAVQRLMQKIEKIPAEGKMMISFAPKAEFISLNFSYDKAPAQTIEIYEESFKTPATGFNTKKSNAEIEAIKDIHALISPELGTRIPKVIGLELKLDSFTIAYLGEEEKKQQPDEPTIGDTSELKFRITDKNKKEQTFNLFAGHTPPKPLIFEVDGSKYILLTHQEKNGEDLFPNYFQVIKK